MDRDLLQKLRRNPRITVINDTVYLDGRLVLRWEADQVSAFQAYDRRTERLINSLLAGTRYTVVEGNLIEYEESGEVKSIRNAMEVLLTWRRRRGR